MLRNLVWIVLLGSVLPEMVAFADDGVFVSTEAQKTLLQEGIEYSKELEKRYSHLTMEGVTEHRDLYNPKEYKHWTESFRFVRFGHEYCLLETHISHKETDIGEQGGVHACRLINPKASYLFLAKGSPPSFSLGEKEQMKNRDHLSRAIDALVSSNWLTGSVAYRVTEDLSTPFDMPAARRTMPKQGGYIKGIEESIVEGRRVVILKMGYYLGETESNGEVSFYPDHYWVVRNSTAEGISAGTGRIVCIFKTNNVYDFSGDFPKLKNTTIETWDADGKKLLKSEISTITLIDFTPPDVSAFDAKRYIGNKDLDDLKVEKQRFSTFQVVMMSIGFLLIAWGLYLRLKKEK